MKYVKLWKNVFSHSVFEYMATTVDAWEHYKTITYNKTW